MTKERWSELKSGVVKPASEAERHALEEYKKDKALLMQYRVSQITERKSTRERREGSLCSYRKKGGSK